MSTSSGNKSRKPKHQNAFSFKHNKHSKKTQAINALPNTTVGLCQRCYDIIEWRKKYRKYKPLKQPKKCNYCQNTNVKHAYHVICQSCAKSKDVCAKCLESGKDIVEKGKTNQEEKMQELDELISTLPERHRRTVLRNLEKNPKLVEEILKDKAGLDINLFEDSEDEEAGGKTRDKKNDDEDSEGQLGDSDFDDEGEDELEEDEDDDDEVAAAAAAKSKSKKITFLD